MARYFMSETRWSGWERMMMDPARRSEPPRPHNRPHRRKLDRPRQAVTIPQSPSREVTV